MKSGTNGHSEGEDIKQSTLGSGGHRSRSQEAEIGQTREHDNSNRFCCKWFKGQEYKRIKFGVKRLEVKVTVGRVSERSFSTPWVE